MNENVAQPLNAQQYQSLAKQYADALIAVKKDIELRKWVMDQACSLCGAEGPVTFTDPIALAKEMHAFIVEGSTSQERHRDSESGVGE